MKDHANFHWVNDNEIAKIRLRIKNFLSRTYGPISTKLGTKHSCMKGIQFCLNEGLRPFPIGNNNIEIAKTQ